ncbi:ribokinase [Cenarchaeum symbiosum A]|uniref:Ribokinase n=1 Tax=Cenarchaeum symbiosum (strain A) TaxID=414004 RepID=A0RX28_CENSY|nr:ribokinase [Cenarchaeum symbiosum A]
MKLAVCSHCTIDTTGSGGSSERQLGGPACYSSITARRLKFDVDLFTRFGPDFPHSYLEGEGIRVNCAPGGGPTTGITMEDGSEGSAVIGDLCGPVEFAGTDADGILASPVFGEITQDVLDNIRRCGGDLFLDPLGFLRKKGPGGRLILEGQGPGLDGAAVRVGPAEAACITGKTGQDAMAALQKMGAKSVLYADAPEVSLLAGDRLYSLKLPNKKRHDTVGLGAILSAAFACTMLKEDDQLWALSFAAGAAQAALDSDEPGTSKVPPRGAVESNASYFYNTVDFKGV